MKPPFPSLVALAVAALLPALARAEALWIDVRSPEEAAESRIDGDPLVPYESIALEIARLAPAKDTEIVLYCRRGGRAGTAQQTLEQLGYTRVRNAGGLDDARRERGCEPSAGNPAVLVCPPHAEAPR